MKKLNPRKNVDSKLKSDKKDSLDESSESALQPAAEDMSETVDTLYAAAVSDAYRYTLSDTVDPFAYPALADASGAVAGSSLFSGGGMSTIQMIGLGAVGAVGGIGAANTSNSTPPPNTPPTSADLTIDVDGDNDVFSEWGLYAGIGVYDFKRQDFTFADADGDSFNSIVIVDIPDGCNMFVSKLTYGSDPTIMPANVDYRVNEGDSIPVYDINNLYFSAADTTGFWYFFEPNTSTSEGDSFFIRRDVDPVTFSYDIGFRVQDDGGTRNGGSDTSALHHLTLNFTYDGEATGAIKLGSTHTVIG